MIQLAANIKIIEAWKATHIEGYPIQFDSNNEHQRATEKELRPTSIRQWKEDGKTSAARESFTRNTAKIWNQSPKAIKDALTLNSVKKFAKVYCKTLPI